MVPALSLHNSPLDCLLGPGCPQLLLEGGPHLAKVWPRCTEYGALHTQCSNPSCTARAADAAHKPGAPAAGALVKPLDLLAFRLATVVLRPKASAIESTASGHLKVRLVRKAFW